MKVTVSLWWTVLFGGVMAVIFISAPLAFVPSVPMPLRAIFLLAATLGMGFLLGAVSIILALRHGG